MARSKIIEGLKSAVRHARGDESQSRTHVVYVDAAKPRSIGGYRKRVAELESEIASLKSQLAAERRIRMDEAQRRAQRGT